MAIITINRGIQSGGRKLAHCLADRLQYDCLSREVITLCARKYNIPEQELYEKLIEAPSRWRKLSRDHHRYLLYVQCALIDAARQDRVIYHGYAGQLFLRGVNHAIKLRLEAPLADRIQAGMAEYHKSYDDTRAFIKDADEQRQRWVKFLYGVDWHDPALYDLSINLANISIGTVCELIALLAESEQFQTTEASIRHLDKLSLECEIKAAIASDDKLWNHSLKVDANGSIVTLRGPVKDGKARDAIMDIVARVKGVSECIDETYLSTESLSNGMSGGWTE